MQDLQGEVESYFLSLEAPLYFQNLILPPKTVSTIINGLWPSTTYRVSLQVSNGAHNTTKASVKVTTEDGGTVCVYIYVGFGGSHEWFMFMEVHSSPTTEGTVYVQPGTSC